MSEASRDITKTLNMWCMTSCGLNSIRHSKNALLIQIGVEIVWDNVDSMHE